MIIILSPSKTIKQSDIKEVSDYSLPIFQSKSEKLVNKIKKLKPKEIASLMNVSSKLAEQTYDKFQFWNSYHSLDNSKQAILSFRGEVYTGLDANTLSDSELLFAQRHLIILSGIYGVLKPLDLIQPYRLEMATKLSILKHNNLYSYWSSSITTELKNKLVESNNNVLINLASEEYSKVINLKIINTRVVTPIFKENKNGIYKVVSVYAKKARGLMTRYIIENSTDIPENIKLFNEEGYYFNNELSSEDEYIFTRG